LEGDTTTDGETLKALAKSYGVTHPTIMRALRKFEVPIFGGRRSLAR
jgi:hypothetical protein